MPSNTEHLNLYKVDPASDGSMTFNIDSMMNENWDKLDEYAQGLEQKLIVSYTHKRTDTIHELTGEGNNLKFLATANFEAGDTFTVNGAPVEAKTVDGQELTTGAFKTGVVVEAFLEGATLTFPFHAAADKLKNTRTIGISGGATGTATSFDGSANITIPVTALDVSKATAGTLPVARGGTGATTAAAALTSLGALPKAGGTMTGNLVANNVAVGTKAVRNIYAGTADMTAGTTALTTGTVYLVYE